MGGRDGDGLDETMPAASSPDADTHRDDPSIGLQETRLAQDLAESATVGQTAPPDAQAEGTTIGRYIVVDRLGAGGMGVVYRAFDPELHREIALKLVRVGDDDATQGPQRLLREAQAMAQLAHPNVVPVYDAGTVTTGGRDDVYIAMEYVEGITVAAWLKQAKRTWRDIVRVFLAAGRGLEAAHAKGLVHRDFKPENALVAADGRVRVLDFGLACLRRTERLSASSIAVVDDDLTAIGTIMGTPRYMSPEQHEGVETDARTDQFSFAVALHEALYGERPFPGDTYADLRDNVVNGWIREPDDPRGVPAFVRRALVRALARRREDRFPAMTQLLDELGRDPDRNRRRALYAGIVVAAAATTGLVTFATQRGGDAVSPCSNQDEHVVAAWNDTRRAHVRAAFLATDASYAADTFERVARGLDAYARDVVAARVDACAATRVRGDQSEALLDLRVRCLDRRTAELAALVDVFADRADRDVLEGAVQAIAKLAPLDRCADAEDLLSAIPPPVDPDVRRRVDELHQELARVEALDRAGKYHEGVKRAAALADAATTTQYAPLRAESLYLRGRLEDLAGKPEAAEATLRAALFAAADARDDTLAAAIWADLVVVIAAPRGRPGDALGLAPFAELAVRRIANEVIAEARLQRALGIVAHAAGKFEDAQTHHGRALELRERRLGPDHDDVAASLTDLGLALKGRNLLDEAREHLERALAIRTRLLGADHPALAITLTHLGVVCRLRGEHAEAAKRHASALRILENALGPDHPRVARSLDSLGVVLRERGDYEAASRNHARALAIREKVYGAIHPEVAMSLNNLGIAARAVGRVADAERYQLRALEIRKQTLGADHPKVALTLNNLGETALVASKPEEARRYHERALAVQDTRLRPDHAERATSLRGMAAALLAHGRAREARPPAEQALKIDEAQTVAPAELAASRFVLAQILWALGERPRALSLARQAREGYARDGEPREREAVDTWLAAHDG